MGVTFSAGLVLRAAALISLGAFISSCFGYGRRVLSQDSSFYRERLPGSGCYLPTLYLVSLSKNFTSSNIFLLKFLSAKK